MTNTPSPELFDVYIVDGGILDDDIKRFESMAQKFGFKIIFLKPDRKYFDKLKVFEVYGEATYYRYFLIDTTTCEKMLFLDCDIVVEGDVVELYETDQQDKIVSAVFEALCPLKHLEKIKLDKSFNAGVFLVNCKKWQEEQVSQKAYQYQLENERILEFPDQDSLNIILKDSWQMIPYKWNVVARLGLVKYCIGKADYRIISKDELFDNYHNPKIIHYANRLFKPWYWLDPSPYKSNYIHYKGLSPWRDIPFPDKSLLGAYKRIWYYLSFVFKYCSRMVKIGSVAS